MSRRSALEAVGPYFDDSRLPVLGRRALHADVAALSDRVSRRPRRGPADPRTTSITSDSIDLRRRALDQLPRLPRRLVPARACPGLRLPRSSTSSARRPSSSRRSTRSSTATAARRAPTSRRDPGRSALAAQSRASRPGRSGSCSASTGSSGSSTARATPARAQPDAGLRARRRRWLTSAGGVMPSGARVALLARHPRTSPAASSRRRHSRACAGLPSRGSRPRGCRWRPAILLAHLVPPDHFGRVAVMIVVSELALALANQGAGSVFVQRKAARSRACPERGDAGAARRPGAHAHDPVPLPLVTTPLFGEPTTQAVPAALAGVHDRRDGDRAAGDARAPARLPAISMIEIARVLVGSVASVALAVLGLEAEAYVLGFVIGLIVWAMLLVIFGPSSLPRGIGANCARSRASASQPGSPACHGRLRQRRLPDPRREASPRPGRFLLPRLHARRPVRDQDQRHHRPPRVPGVLTNREPRPHARGPLAGDADQRHRHLSDPGAVHRHRPGARAVALRRPVGAGGPARPDPRGGRHGADDQQRHALRCCSQPVAPRPCWPSTSAGSGCWARSSLSRRPTA